MLAKLHRLPVIIPGIAPAGCECSPEPEGTECWYQGPDASCLEPDMPQPLTTDGPCCKQRAPLLVAKRLVPKIKITISGHMKTKMNPLKDNVTYNRK